MSQIERRSLPVKNLELRQRGGRAVLAGTAIVFGEWSLDLGGFVERVAPSFVDRTLDRVRRGVHRLLALWNHESSLPIGNTSPKGGLKVTKRSHGLDFELPASNLTDAQRAAIERGDIASVSFGFHVSKDSWEKGENGEPDRRTLIDGEIMELSPCTFAAYPQTNLLLAKRSHDAWLDREQERERPLELRRQLEDWRQRLAADCRDDVVLTGRAFHRATYGYPKTRLERTAWHESGHAVAALAFGLEVDRVYLAWQRRGVKLLPAGGMCETRGICETRDGSAVLFLAGVEAEKYAPSAQCRATIPGGDLAEARWLAQADDEFSRARQRARTIVVKRLNAIDLIARQLQYHGELDGRQVERLYRAHTSKNLLVA